jgi:hypothetical protein
LEFSRRSRPKKGRRLAIHRCCCCCCITGSCQTLPFFLKLDNHVGNLN